MLYKVFFQIVVNCMYEKCYELLRCYHINITNYSYNNISIVITEIF
jgi:hypothetical protein